MPCSRPPSIEVTAWSSELRLPVCSCVLLPFSLLWKKDGGNTHPVLGSGLLSEWHKAVATALLALVDSHSDLAVSPWVLPTVGRSHPGPGRTTARRKPQWNYKLAVTTNPHDTES